MQGVGCAQRGIKVNFKLFKFLVVATFWWWVPFKKICCEKDRVSESRSINRCTGQLSLSVEGDA